MTIIRKILIAEDELIVARVLKRVLELNHFEVRQVSNAEEAIRVASDSWPDLIILDIHLQDKGCGIMAGKKIREHKVESPILFITGNSFEQTKKEIEGISNTFLFIKPIDSDHLVKFIRTRLS
ncbi:MAG: response regulator [Bacteroidia bacterium]